MKMENCPVCVESRRKESWVTCPKCNFSCCRLCVKKFLLGLNELTPKCMSCSIRWTYEFIADNTHNAFHNNEYRDHRAKILMERERSLLPATQPYVEQEKMRENFQTRIAKLNVRIKKLEAKTKELKARKDSYAEMLYQMEITEEVHAEPRKYIGRCPVDDCKGFLEKLETMYVCGLCKTKACKECRKLSEEDHKCNGDDVATVKLLASDTKPCPGCSVPIFKTEGCDQMYCVKCHTAFSWSKGTLERGRIHNPHFYEFLRKQGGTVPREVGDVLCGGAPNILEIIDKINHLNIHVHTFLQAHEVAGHIRAIELPRYQIRHDEHKDLRIQYLLGQLTDEQWLLKLKKRDKQKEKHTAISLILTMTADTIDTLLNNFIHVTTKNRAEQILQQLETLRKYSNEQLERLSEKIGNKVPCITGTWNYNRSKSQ